jgi:hypothetical protein
MRIFLNAINNPPHPPPGQKTPVLDATNRLTDAQLPHDASALGCLGTIGCGGAGIHARGNLRFSGAIGSVATLLVD